MAAADRPLEIIDSEEEEGGEWEEWQESVPEEEEEDGNNEDATRCLLCTQVLPSPQAALQHCANTHSFDFLKLRADARLDFYDTLRLINFIRSKVAACECWSCEEKIETGDALLQHLVATKHANLLLDTKQKRVDSGIAPDWKDDKHLTPFLEDDPLLYGFDDVGDDNRSEELDVVDRNTALQELLQGPSDVKTSSATDGKEASDYDIADLTKVFLSLGDGIREELASPMDMSIPQFDASSSPASSLQEHKSVVVGENVNRVNKPSHGSEKVFPKKDRKDLKVTFSEVAKRELRNVNKDYFGSYSAFGIHREMLSDKVRTDAYRDAIVANPSLVKDAVVMDVGCGTGILSLFAAQAGASKVIAVDGSTKMASVATQIAKVNGFLKDNAATPETSSKGVITVVSGMIEELDSMMPVPVQEVDVLVSEWMGYCLLFESMLPSVLHARDRWLKPGGAILPDTAEMYVAGFGKGGTSLAFWENVYGFNMRCVGEEVVHDATQSPIIDVVNSKEVITTSSLLQAFDLVTMKHEDVDFTSQFKLELVPSTASGEVTWCYGLVVWFDTGFTNRFCKEKPVLLTTSPYSPRTHWSQTLLTFREPIALCRPGQTLEKIDKGKLGSESCPATAITGRISIARSHRHRSIDISLETSAVSKGNSVRTWPVQMFDI